MAAQPLGGICWGASAWRPCWPLSTALGSVSWLAPGLPPAAAPSPPGASRPPLPPPPWPSLALPPPAVLRPTRTAVASRPTRIVDLLILRVSPGPPAAPPPPLPPPAAPGGLPPDQDRGGEQADPHRRPDHPPGQPRPLLLPARRPGPRSSYRSSWGKL